MAGLSLNGSNKIISSVSSTLPTVPTVNTPPEIKNAQHLEGWNKVMNTPVPRTREELLTYISMLTKCKGCIKSFSKTIRPLMSLWLNWGLRRDMPECITNRERTSGEADLIWQWDECCTGTFLTIKEQIQKFKDSGEEYVDTEVVDPEHRYAMVMGALEQESSPGLPEQRQMKRLLHTYTQPLGEGLSPPEEKEVCVAKPSVRKEIDIARVHVVCNGFRTKAVVDSGAAVSIVSERFIKQVCSSVRKYGDDTPLQIRSANGGLEEACGSTTLRIRIGGRQVTWRFHVMKSLPVPILLGVDFLKGQRAILDFDEGTLGLRALGSWVPVLLETKPLVGTYDVHMVEQITLGPWQETEVNVDTRHQGIPVSVSAVEAIIAPVQDHGDNPAWMTAYSINRTISGKAVSRICNWTGKSLTLPVGTIVGTMDVEAEIKEVSHWNFGDSRDELLALVATLQSEPIKCEHKSEQQTMEGSKAESLASEQAGVTAVEAETGQKANEDSVEAETSEMVDEKAAEAGLEEHIGEKRNVADLPNGVTEDMLSHLPNIHRVRLRELLSKWKGVFSLNPGAPTTVYGVACSINTGEALPIAQPPRRKALSHRKVLMDEIEKMLKDGIIQESRSPWASPCVLVKKTDGQWRFCIDYRKVNAVTKKEVYPLPRIDDCLSALGQSRYFTTLDMAAGYWQVRMSDKDREKTAFVTTEGQWEFRVMPFGLTNAPATFQRLMDATLAGLKWSSCLVYLDDVIIFSKDFETHLQDVEKVFNRLAEANLSVKGAKCSFAQPVVKYLGHIVSRAGISPDPKKVQAIKDFPRPESRVHLQSFLGLAGYYRKFMKNFSTLAFPLLLLVQHWGMAKQPEEGVKPPDSASQVWQWDDDCEKAFTALKNLLTSEPILARPDETLPFTVTTDASIRGLGAVLTQKQGGREVVIEYLSRSLTQDEKKWTTTEQEALGVIYACEYWRHYLVGVRFTVETDHSALRWVLGNPKPGRLTRWGLRLQEFDYDVVHRRGRDNQVSDAMSRYPIPTEVEDDDFDRNDREVVQCLLA